MGTAVVRAPGAQLQMCGVSKYFETEQGRLHVLEGIHLVVKKGEFVCVLGPSGSGKSTLFNIAAGLEQPDSGEVLVQGRPAAEPGPERVALFQQEAVFPWLTVRGNVEFGLRMLGLPPAARRERTGRALAMVRLGRFADARPHQLSDGARRRVAIARAVAMEPAVLLMDEPFATLDAQTRNVLHEDLQRIWQEAGLTILFFTRNVAEAVRLGDRVAVLAHRPGRIKRQVSIHQPRPRLADDPHLIEIRTFLLRTLKEDVRAVVEEEFGDA